jgi:hypothetical protein
MVAVHRIIPERPLSSPKFLTCHYSFFETTYSFRITTIPM